MTHLSLTGPLLLKKKLDLVYRYQLVTNVELTHLQRGVGSLLWRIRVELLIPSNVGVLHEIESCFTKIFGL